MKLKDRVALVTGGAHGIGAALCLRFAEEGARAVAVADLDARGAERTAEAVRARGAHALAIPCDVSREAPIRRAVARCEGELGGLDLFVQNAGFGYSDAPGWTAASQTDEQWDSVWRVNVMAHVWGARAALPGMLSRGSGYFVHTVSAAGLISQIGDAAYSTTKHAAIGFAESLAITHGDQGIGVAVLAPQGVRTRLIEHSETVKKSVSTDGIREPEEVAQCVIEGLEDGRFLILPHPESLEYLRRKTADYDRWLGGMRRFRRSLFPSDDIMRPGDPPGEEK
ncbi:MAG: SDR family oxidoreductase [Acidobacteriota bacterium]